MLVDWNGRVFFCLFVPIFWNRWQKQKRAKYEVNANEPAWEGERYFAKAREIERMARPKHTHIHSCWNVCECDDGNAIHAYRFDPSWWQSCTHTQWRFFAYWGAILPLLHSTIPRIRRQHIHSVDCIVCLCAFACIVYMRASTARVSKCARVWNGHAVRPIIALLKAMDFFFYAYYGSIDKIIIPNDTMYTISNSTHCHTLPHLSSLYYTPQWNIIFGVAWTFRNKNSCIVYESSWLMSQSLILSISCGENYNVRKTYETNTVFASGKNKMFTHIFCCCVFLCVHDWWRGLQLIYHDGICVRKIIALHQSFCLDNASEI